MTPGRRAACGIAFSTPRLPPAGFTWRHWGVSIEHKVRKGTRGLQGSVKYIMELVTAK
jgi:hypothetical protein